VCSNITWHHPNGKGIGKADIACKIFKHQLMHTTAIVSPHVVLVTSAAPHEGKTTTATQLAASLARSGRRTLLVDGDIRSPGAHRVFEMPLEPGLCELLRGEVDREAVLRPHAHGQSLAAAGRPLRSAQRASAVDHVFWARPFAGCASSLNMS